MGAETLARGHWELRRMAWRLVAIAALKREKFKVGLV
jgi:hypothetical protein